MIIKKFYVKNKKNIRAVLFMCGLFFIFLLVNKSWTEISESLVKIDYKSFLLSLFFALIGNVSVALLFNKLLSKHNVIISNFLALKLFFIGQIAKYIPGKIWGIAYQISHMGKASNTVGIMLANIELTIAMLFITTIIAFVLLASLSNYIFSLFLIIVGMICFVFIYKKNLLAKLVELMPINIELNHIVDNKEQDIKDYVAVCSFYLIFFLMYVLSYVFMLNAIFDFSFSEAVFYISILSLAWIGGVLAFVVPVGMGVREFLFIYASGLIDPQQSIEILASIAIISRFWQVIQELLGAMLIFILKLFPNQD